MNRKLIFSGAAVVIAALLLVKFLKADNNEYNPESIGIESAGVLKTNKKKVQQGTLPIKQQENTQPQQATDNNNQHDDKYKQVGTVGQCGYVADKFYNSPFRKNVSKLSEIQLRAFEKLEANCHAWYDYVNALSADEQKSLKQRIKQDRDSRNFNAFSEKNTKFINEAVASLKSPINENRELRYIEQQVGYLLLNDSELQDKLATKLGVNESLYKFSDTAGIFVASLFMCEFVDCSNSSISSLSACVDSEQACGLSFPAYLQSISSYGQFTDWQNAAYALREIFASDWFQNRDTGSY